MQPVGQSQSPSGRVRMWVGLGGSRRSIRRSLWQGKACTRKACFSRIGCSNESELTLSLGKPDNHEHHFADALAQLEGLQLVDVCFLKICSCRTKIRRGFWVVSCRGLLDAGRKTSWDRVSAGIKGESFGKGQFFGKKALETRKSAP